MSSDGGYRIDVSDLQAPFLVEVVGTVGGNAAILHSAATAADVDQGRTVNVTPLTELATAFVLGSSPAAVFRDGSRTLVPLTDDALSSAGGEVRAALAPLLAAFGADVDPRTTPFTADGTGMDGALDAIKLLPVQDAGTGAARYELSLVTGSGTVMLDPAAPPGGAVISFSSDDLARLQAALAALPAIDAQLQALAAKLATSVPAAGEVSSFFAPGFRHHGLGLDDYLSKVLLTSGRVGFTLSTAALESVPDAGHVWISSRLGVTRSVPWRESFRMDLGEDSAWRIAGDQAVGTASATYLAKLVAKPPTEAEVAALDGVVSYDAGGETCYRLPYAYAGPHGEYAGMYHDLGCSGAVFPLLVTEGSVYDNLGTADQNERQVMATYSRYLGHPSAGLNRYLMFAVSAVELQGDVDHVVVSGPGIPAGGLTLVRTVGPISRDYLILKGDTWNWNGFDTSRCPDLDTSSIPDCALDWSAVVEGASYTFTFHGASEVLGSITARLMGSPRSEDVWLGLRNSAFPLMQLDGAHDYSYRNLLDTAAGTSFLTGASETVSWTRPTDPTVVMDFVSIWRRGYLGDTGVPGDEREETCSTGLYGSTSTSFSCPWSASWLATWGWSTLGAKDLFGNALWYEVSPGNPD